MDAICKNLADTNTGLPGSEIGDYLQTIGVKDIDSENTKWKRLYNDLANRQNLDKKGNIVLAFTSKSLQPTRFIHKPELFKETIFGRIFSTYLSPSLIIYPGLLGMKSAPSLSVYPSIGI